MNEYLSKRMAHILNGRPLPQKKSYTIPKVSKKRAEKIKQQSIANTDEGLDKWFEERRKEMTGFCKNCGEKSCKNNDEYFKFSIAHLLPKTYFKSVATHPDNWIELCFWGNNSCHTQMDNKLLDLIDMNCFDEIVVKFQKIYPFIAADERRRIPQILMQYLNTDV